MAAKKLIISEKPFTLNELTDFVHNEPLVELDKKSIAAIQAGRQIVKRIVESEKAVYGVNTGFGKFAEVRIPRDKVAELQRRLVVSHAAGVGRPMPRDAPVTTARRPSSAFSVLMTIQVPRTGY